MLAASYRRRPLLVYAAQWDGTDGLAADIVEWIGVTRHRAQYLTDETGEWVIEWLTPDGNVATARPKDWVVRRFDEFHVCGPDLFPRLYEET